jgi:NAD(P)-dependent dehydrogenase (short-subunit alcohol dehydrogenase family)
LTPLAGQMAVVTGASRGIGLATATALRGCGAMVVRLSRSLSDGESGGFRDFRCDLSEAAQIERTCRRILEQIGTPSLVVQNAGVFLLRPLEETGTEELDRHIAINLRAPFLIARALLPAMRSAGRGMHITLGSVSDHTGFPENAAYAATKWGVRGLHEVLTAEYQGTGVRFSLISPGATDTPVWDPFDPDARPGFLRRAMMLRPEDVADAVVFAATRPSHATVEWLRLSPAPAGGE